MAEEENDIPEYEARAPGIGLRIVSALSYCALFFVPLLTHPKNKFARFHANQGMFVFFVAVVTVVLLRLSMTNILIVMLLAPLLMGLVIFFLMVFFTGIVNALSGKMERVSLIGKFDLMKGGAKEGADNNPDIDLKKWLEKNDLT